MKKIRLTKISDDIFGGNHPNGINKGYTRDGYMIHKPKEGEEFILYLSKLHPYLYTSIVTKKLNKKNIFKTTYSTYQIEYIN